MAEDFELSAAITVEDESELEGLTTDVGAEDGGQAGIVGGGQGGGGQTGILGKRLTAIVGLLSRVLAVVGVITLIPGLLDGVFRLLEIALLPIGVLFQNLLAPILQKLLRFFATSNFLDKVAGLGQIIARSIQGLISDLSPVIQGVGSTLDSIATKFNNAFGGGESGQQELSPSQQVGLSTARGVAPTLPGGFGASLLINEFTAARFDDTVSKSNGQTTQEDGPGG